MESIQEFLPWIVCAAIVLSVLAIAAASASNTDAPTESTRRQAAADDVPMGNEGCMFGSLLIGFALFAVFLYFMYR